jgi:hypothetical protein
MPFKLPDQRRAAGTLSLAHIRQPLANSDLAFPGPTPQTKKKKLPERKKLNQDFVAAWKTSW